MDYTEPINQPSIAVAAEGRRRPLNGGIGSGVGSTLFVGRVEVTDEFVGYRRKRYDRVVQTCGLELPPVQFATVGVRHVHRRAPRRRWGRGDLHL